MDINFIIGGYSMSKSILITGASRGLGFYLAKKYLEDGHRVFAGVRNKDDVNLQGLKEEYPNLFIPIILEVSSTESVDRAFVEVSMYTSTIDIIINNAAIHSDSSYHILEETNIDDCLHVYDVNSLGPIRVTKAFVPMIRKSLSGKIINISSESGSINSCRREKEFDYCMSKAALNMATKLLSNYLRNDNVIVLSIHPGWMRTDMGGQNAHLDPYETACKLVALFDSINDVSYPIFIDNDGNELLL